MASPSLALLAALIAGRARPSRLLVQVGSPSFAAHISRIVGAVPEAVSFDDSHELRVALQRLGSHPSGAWGVATHRPEALVPSEWFEAFAAGGVPTVELCLGGLFPLARRGSSAATFTIVSLDDEPAFEGVQLTALLTNDAELAQRVRDLCLAGPQGEDCIIDARPRGLVDDEAALLTLVDRAIARDEREHVPVPKRGVSLVWKRVFQSGSSEPSPTPDPVRVPAPRGKNPWLARLAEIEGEHLQALDRARESHQALNALSEKVADPWKGRFEALEKNAASRVEQLTAALREAQRGAHANEKNRGSEEEEKARLAGEWAASRQALSERITTLDASLAEGKDRETALRKESHELRTAIEAANRRNGVLAQELVEVQGQRGTATMEARRLEEALRSQSRYERAALEAQFQIAQKKVSKEAAGLARAQAEAVARLEAQITALEESRDQARAGLKSALAERDRNQELPRAFAAEAEAERPGLQARVREADEARAAAAATVGRLEDEIARLTSHDAAIAVERNHVAARLLQAEGARDAAQQLADQRAALVQNEQSAEAARTSAMISEWKERFDAAARASVKETERLETHHAAVLAKLHEEQAQHDRAEASLTGRLAEMEQTRDTASREGDALRLRLHQMQRERDDEVSGLRLALAEAQARFDATLAATSAEAQASISELLAASTLLRNEMAHIRKQAEVAGVEHASQAISLEKRMSVIETEKARMARERDQLIARHATQVESLQEKAGQLKEPGSAATREAKSLGLRLLAIERERASASAAREAAEVLLSQAEDRHQEGLRLAEGQIALLRREALDGQERRDAEWRARLEAVTISAAEEAQQVEGRQHAEKVGREKSHLEELRLAEQRFAAATEAQDKEMQALRLRSSRIEGARVKAVEERDALETQSHQMEETQGTAHRNSSTDSSPREPAAPSLKDHAASPAWDYERAIRSQKRKHGRKDARILGWLDRLTRRIRGD